MKKPTNLVWIDLEMTGLDPDNDTILEIATLVTDGNLNVLEKGPELVINHPDVVVDTMNDWCKEHHGKSGLTQAVKDSTISMADAEQQTLAFIQKYCIEKFSPLCGNSVWMDREFLRRYMPKVTDYLHYRIVDVSSFGAAIRRWYPDNKNIAFQKKEVHRALDDIVESVEELKHYRQNFFIEN